MKRIKRIGLLFIVAALAISWSVDQDLFSASTNGYRVSVKYKGRLPHGDYKSWFDSTSVRDQGRFRYGIPDGEWKGWYSNGQPRFIRTYSVDKLQRVKREMKKPPKQVLLPLAKMAQENPDALRQASSPLQSFWHLYGKRHEETPPVRVDSVLLASLQFNEQAGDQSYMAPFRECLHHGLYMNFFPNGQVKDSGYYRNGLREGHWEHWLSKGLLRASGTYENGLRTGNWSYNDPNGKIRSLATYNKKGELVHQQFYDR
jgi:antitoxin component YwqK of YwqJK toxin-antitoxin module